MVDSPGLWRPRVLGAAVVLTLLLLGAPVPPAQADSVTLCTGYVDCKRAGYSHAGYRGASDASYWRMYSGHNCTNYVAYRMVRAGLPNSRPWSGEGNAENWGHAMSELTDDTPMVGSVAWWGRNVGPAGSSGHVAYVERVVSSTEIWVSEDSWRGDFHWRRITKSGSSWPSGFIHFKDLALRSRTAPAVAGAAEVGRTLTAVPGTWSPAATSYTYRWLADGKPIRRATEPTFVLRPRRLGQQISVAVSASTTGYVSGRSTSTVTSSVAPGSLTTAAAPVVTGEALVGSVLTTSRGSWSPRVDSRTIQWRSDGKPIEGATGWSLELQPSQAGTRITSVVTATRTGYESSSVSSAPTPSVWGGEVTLTEPFAVSGVPRLGRRLQVVPGSFEPAQAVPAYTWLRNGKPIPGATGPTYVLEASDVGARMSLRVDLTHPGYKPAAQTTGTTSAVHSIPQLAIRAEGGPLRATVAVVVSAPGVAEPRGKVTVRVGSQTRTVRLRDGERTVVLKPLRAGARKVVVTYLGAGLVERVRVRDHVRVRKP